MSHGVSHTGSAVEHWEGSWDENQEPHHNRIVILLGLKDSTSTSLIMARVQSRIKVVTYNVQSFPNAMRMLIPSVPTKRKDVKCILNADPFRESLIDFIVFTESFCSSVTSDLKTTMESRGYHCTERPAALMCISGGVFICSRTALVMQTTVVFSSAWGADALSAKGFSYAETMIGGVRVGIVGTHLQAFNDVKRRSARTKQIQEIRDFIDHDDRVQADLVVVAGDLNVDFGSADYEGMLRLLRAHAPRISKQSSALGVGGWRSRDPMTNSLAMQQEPDSQPEHLDYILVLKGSPHADVVKNITRVVRSPPPCSLDQSDHHAVLGIVELNAVTAHS